MCNDASQCGSGLTCRLGLFNQNQQQCLQPYAKELGAECMNNNDCNGLLICNRNIFGTMGICMMGPDIFGSVVCGGPGHSCGSATNCFSQLCMDVDESGLLVCT